LYQPSKPTSRTNCAKEILRYPEFAAQASGGKDAGLACLKNDTTVFHFFYRYDGGWLSIICMRKMGAGYVLFQLCVNEITLHYR
jgi:hypothetical protein